MIKIAPRILSDFLMTFVESARVLRGVCASEALVLALNQMFSLFLVLLFQDEADFSSILPLTL